jgi:hypothetical protein
MVDGGKNTIRRPYPQQFGERPPPKFQRRIRSSAPQRLPDIRDFRIALMPCIQIREKRHHHPDSNDQAYNTNDRPHYLHIDFIGLDHAT